MNSYKRDNCYTRTTNWSRNKFSKNKSFPGINENGNKIYQRVMEFGKEGSYSNQLLHQEKSNRQFLYLEKLEKYEQIKPKCVEEKH